jgi:MFS superfamily sulfate permease-like transporter
MVLLSLQFLTPLFYYIPEAALAAVIMMAISNMIDFSMIPHMWRVKSWYSAPSQPLVISVICYKDFGA